MKFKNIYIYSLVQNKEIYKLILKINNYKNLQILLLKMNIIDKIKYKEKKEFWKRNNN